MKLTWYDGGLMPPRPAEFSDEMVATNGQWSTRTVDGGGVMFIGSKGKLLHDTYGYNPRLLPHVAARLVRQAGAEARRASRRAHEMNWVDAAKGNDRGSSPFEYAARLIEVMLLGVVSLRARTQDRLRRARTCASPTRTLANEFLRREYRNGFKLTTV